jgi:hypothetical protein
MNDLEMAPTLEMEEADPGEWRHEPTWPGLGSFGPDAASLADAHRWLGGTRLLTADEPCAQGSSLDPEEASADADGFALELEPKPKRDQHRRDRTAVRQQVEVAILGGALGTLACLGLAAAGWPSRASASRRERVQAEVVHLAATASQPPIAPALAVSAKPALPSEQEAQRLLSAWREAQNTGDFEAYAGFYAPEFAGVRRSGPRAVAFDRSGWLRDRARMFRSPMVVRVSDVRIEAAQEGLMARFTQEFSTSTYRDIGTKEIVLRETEAGLQIEREEMLQSRESSPDLP